MTSAGARLLMRCDRWTSEPAGSRRRIATGAASLPAPRPIGDVSRGRRAPSGRDACFESGPAGARGVSRCQTSFIRFAIQPAVIRGQSSILYVDPADAGRGRPRRYTVYVDEPIAL